MQVNVDGHYEGQREEALRRHLERRIRRSYLMFGRGPTLRYVARLAGVEGDPTDSGFPGQAEAALGLQPGTISRLTNDPGPS
jgi:hypothetical protein